MKIFNTLTRKKEAFKPLRSPEVKVYYCGPTVYNHAHIWNLKTSVVEDLVVKTLQFLWYKVTTTMNITDIDDKTIRDSQASGKKLLDFTKKYTDIFLEDLEKLSVDSADNVKAISGLIPEMIRMIQTMLNRWFAYVSEDGSVYFDVKKSKNYGKLANLDMSSLKESVRIDNDEYDKDAAADFVLWKAWKQEDGENYWNAEFTVHKEKKILKGRPGWHIECSACAMKFFGPQIDIHMWGEDLIFPHHQNEIAQTEACTGKQFSKYWIHSGHLMVDGKKMSKSLWNFYTLRDIEERFPKEARLMRAVRLSFINGNYREQINFSFEKLEQNINTLKNIDELCKRLVRYTAEYSGVHPEFREYLQEVMVRFIEALEDDFAFPEALVVMFEFNSFVSQKLSEGEMTSDEQNACADMLMSFNQVFDILDTNIFDIEEESLPQEVIQKVKERDFAKSDKNYALADSLRDEIMALWYNIIDTKERTVVEKA